MDMIRSVTQTVLGNTQQDQTPTGAETVERIVERVISSSLLEDRRDGCRGLRSLARKYRVLVGAHAMDALLQALEADGSDHDLVNYALETLIAITSPEPFDEEIEEMGSYEVCEGLGQQFTEILTKKTDTIALFLGLLDEFDFKVRYPAVKLFGNLLENRAKGVQECVLEVPSGVSKLMDLLSDSREVIRNHALLLLTHLTKGNATLQKIVVFENVFDTIFVIIKSEGYSEGGVVVEDCLELLLTLLRTSPPNQTLFKEGGYIAHINTFFSHLLDESAADIKIWSTQRSANVHKMLELVCSLVQPSCAQSELSQSQNMIRSSGLLPTLSRLLLASGVPAFTLSLTIVTIGDSIKGNNDSQLFFNGVMAPSTPPRPAVVVLLMSLVNERQNLKLRCSVLYCLHSLLFSNSTLQAKLVATLLPQTTQAEEISSGQLLCGGLFSNDPTSTWLCAIALSYAFNDNSEQKDQLLRVQLATGTSGGCVSLLQQCCTLLLNPSAVFISKVGLLQLLALWLVQCPRAVTQLLSVDSVMPYLTAQISSSETEDQETQVVQGLCSFIVSSCALYNEDAPNTLSRAQITSLVTDRIGAHIFRNKLSNLARTELFTQSSRSSRVSASTDSELCFDASFMLLYRTLESSLLRAVNIGEASEGEILEKKVSTLEQQLTETKQTITSLTAENIRLQEANNQLMQTISTVPNSVAVQQHITELTYARDYYYYQFTEKDKLLQEKSSEKVAESSKPLTNGNSPSNGAELETLRCQLQDLQLVLQKKDESIYKMEQHVTDKSTDIANNSLLTQQLSDLQKRLQETESVNRNLEERNKDLQKNVAEIQVLQSRVLNNGVQSEALRSESTMTLQNEKKNGDRLQNELSSLQSEQEDLLLLLAEQDGRLQRYRSHLTVRGVSPPPGEEGEDEEDEEDLQ